MLVASEGLAGGLNNALPPSLVGLRAKCPRVGFSLRRGSKEGSNHPSSGLPAVASHDGQPGGGHVMFVIGIDPHKGSHTAAVLG
jgi:hypothetical protein